MNNEEKILAILETMQSDISGLKDEQRTTNGRLDAMQSDISDLKAKSDRMGSEFAEFRREQGTMQRTLNDVKKVADATFEETGKFAEFQTQTRQDIEELRARQA